MQRRKLSGRRVVAAGLVAVVLGAATAAVASNGDTPRPAVLERDVTNTDVFAGGEPEIAVNPLNPKNLVYVSTAYKYVHVDAAGQTVDLTPGSQILTNGIFDSQHCFIAFSDDGGETWTPGKYPNGDRPACGDPMVAAGPDGTFYVGQDWMGSSVTPLLPSSSGDVIPGAYENDVAYLSSRDGGRTWQRYGSSSSEPGHDMPVETGTEVDRPFFRVDMARPSQLYSQSGGFSQNPRMLATSKDHGRTWSAGVPFPGSHLAVYDGIVATADQAGGVAVPLVGPFLPSTGGTTGLVLDVLNTDGKTYTSHPVTDSAGHPVSGGSGDWVSADPTQRGRFAVMQQRGDTYEVYVTPNAGATWTGPLKIAAPAAAKPWMDYGPSGVLGVMWKDTAEGKVLSVISNGGTFSKPLQVNSEAHEFTSGLGDDLSWITFDKKHAYLGWGDTRNGYCHGYFAKVALSEYRFAS
jgi:hypothetical protein